MGNSELKFAIHYLGLNAEGAPFFNILVKVLAWEGTSLRRAIELNLQCYCFTLIRDIYLLLRPAVKQNHIQSWGLEITDLAQSKNIRAYDCDSSTVIRLRGELRRELDWERSPILKARVKLEERREFRDRLFNEFNIPVSLDDWVLNCTHYETGGSA